MFRINTKNRNYFKFLLYFRNVKADDGLFISKKSVISSDTVIGSGSRINGRILIKGSGKCEIGKYCALGSDIKIITSNHDTSFMNLQLSLQRRIGAETKAASRKNIVIGHNVWIGDSVIILPGVEIGNGVVIGAGSVVTKDVPSYAIAAGNPAKIIKYRFNSEKIIEIEELRWWNWSLQKMKSNIELFNRN